MTGPCMCGDPGCGSCGPLLGGSDCGPEDGCAYCGQLLPADPADGTWPFEGYCDAECALRYCVARCRWPDDNVHGLTRKRAVRALEAMAGRSLE